MPESRRILEQLYWHSLDSAAALDKIVKEDTSHGKTTSDLCSALLTLAQTQLLFRNDVEKCKDSLCRIARVLLDFLQRRAVDDTRFCCIGCMEVVDASFAVMAASEFSLLREIIDIACRHAFIQQESSSVEGFTWRTLVALVTDQDRLLESLVPGFNEITKKEEFCIGFPVVVEAIAREDDKCLDTGLFKINAEFAVDRRRKEPNFGYMFALPVVAYFNLAIARGMSPRLGFDSEWVPIELMFSK